MPEINPLLLNALVISCVAFQILQMNINLIVDEDVQAENSPAEMRKRRRLLKAELPYMMNNMVDLGRPLLPIGFRDRVGEMSLDPGRNYFKKLTHLFVWEFEDLAAILKSAIEKPRSTRRILPVNGNGNGNGNINVEEIDRKSGRPTKYDHRNRLEFTLEWLSSGDFLNKMEFDYKLSKSSIQEDLYHETICADGGFVGHGPNLTSFDRIDEDYKRIYNAAFTEYRKGVECAFGRVQRWFPITGVNKTYWTHKHELLVLAVTASMKLHNWMMRNRHLEYNAENNPYNYYRDMY
jgi:hypothetical protein